MTFTTCAVRLRRTAFTALFTTAGLCACGGGEETDAATHSAALAVTVEAASAGPAMVEMEGCVVDRNFVPRNGSVRALFADGRLAASGSTNRYGVFVLRVPAQTNLKLELDAPEPQTLVLLSGRANFSVAACLIDTRE